MNLTSWIIIKKLYFAFRKWTIKLLCIIYNIWQIYSVWVMTHQYRSIYQSTVVLIPSLCFLWGAFPSSSQRWLYAYLHTETIRWGILGPIHVSNTQNAPVCVKKCYSAEEQQHWPSQQRFTRLFPLVCFPVRRKYWWDDLKRRLFFPLFILNRNFALLKPHKNSDLIYLKLKWGISC